MKTKYAIYASLALGILVSIIFLVASGDFDKFDGEIRSRGEIQENGISSRSSNLRAGQNLPIRIGSLEDARRNLDPRVFQPLGPKAYQIVRLDDARPPGDALDYIQSLIKKSQSGDSIATFNIYLAVSDCRNYLSGATERAPDSDTNGTASISELERTDRKLSECTSLAASHGIAEERWLEIAAQQGSVEAKLYYSIDSDSIIGNSTDRISHPEKLISWKEQSIDYLKEAAGTGNIDAITRLSSAYENGILADRNLELSYAYALAAKMIDPNSSGPTTISNLEKNLSKKQRESGELLSRSIYKSCCTP